jgi:uncharacterized membrane protein YfcA
MELILILMVVLVAALIKGITGFGFTLVALPVLAIWYPVKTLIPILTICNLLASLVIVLQKKSIPLINRNSRILIFSGSISTIFGVALLSALSNTVITLIIAIFLAILSVVSYVGKLFFEREKMVNYIKAGVISGIVTGAASINGPPLAIFLNGIRMDKAEFREVFSWFSIVTAVVAIVGYYLGGLLNIEELRISVMFFPILYIGSFLGKRINALLPSKTFTKMSSIICLVSCIILTITTLK